jgi:uncharacterized protein
MTKLLDIHEDQAASGPVVTGFTPRGFKLGEQRIETGLLMTPKQAAEWDAPALDQLTAAGMGLVIALNPLPEFIVLGTGKRLVHPPRALVRELDALGIGVEPMDSKAAARAWALLRAEDRWIAAALLPIYE